MIDFGIKDAIDILCVAFLLYYFFKIMKDSGSMNTFFGIVVFFLLWIVVSPVLEMKLMGTIFDKLVSVGVLALIILFQEDIRRFFLTLGSSNRFTTIRKLFTKKKNKEEENPAVMQIVRACAYMSKNNIGALIIIERNMALTDIAKTGEIIDANINAQLIKNIFFKNSPLHDGAMIISNNRISARKTMASATVPRWVSRSRATPCRWWCRRKRDRSRWPAAASSSSRMPLRRSWRAT